MNYIGIGLRTPHFSAWEEFPPKEINYLEALSENHMTSRGRPYHILEKLRDQYALSFHGVSLSIARHDGLDQKYLKMLKAFIDEFNPLVVSDHLCWTGLPHQNAHNLLPVPYNQKSLEFIRSRVLQVQDFLKREIALENLSAYVDFKTSTMNEWEFWKSLLQQTDCKMMLDLNNVYVNAKNHQFDAKAYIDAIPYEKIAQVHLAGFTDMGKFLFDTHSRPVYPEVWNLYRHLNQSKGPVNTIVEWDDDIPELKVVIEEALKAKNIMEEFL
ncbi:MAG: DUF692 domain-containing protein [Bacteriovoracaceae bacterium]